VREVAVRDAGIEPQQYLMLLQVKGIEGRQLATVRVLAERLQIRHHAAVQLVDRLVARRLVERRRSGRDRREVLVCLRPAGQKLLRVLASRSVDELRLEGPQLVSSLRRLIVRSTGGKALSPNGTGKAKS
jgi:DNA-binding MarR family transcriptional regulator